MPKSRGRNEKRAVQQEGIQSERRSVQNDINYDSTTPLWSFSRLDIEGPWCWGNTDIETVMYLFRELKQFETMNWVQVNQGGSHNISINKIIREAQKRLEELKLDDVEELYSLRLSGKERVFGIKDKGVLRILWWDPLHEICPSVKR